MKNEIFGIHIPKLKFNEYIDEIFQFSVKRKKGYVCVANVHMLVESRLDASFMKIMQDANFIVPDGMPLVWLLNCFDDYKCERVAGYDLVIQLFKKLEGSKHSILFYGSTTDQLNKIKNNVSGNFPDLKISGLISPPFGKITNAEREKILSEINIANPSIILVALGCPKQEKWMNEIRDHVDCLMIGVGGAFSLLSGEQPRAPFFIRKIGFEWLYRLSLEPRRLWKRYLVTNSLFIYFLFYDYLFKPIYLRLIKK
jgi:N-acetylglucosaminyldiphosphoundecaprenol N-acetyl-beta-D-mannosaminyltransferase